MKISLIVAVAACFLVLVLAQPGPPGGPPGGPDGPGRGPPGGPGRGPPFGGRDGPGRGGRGGPFGRPGRGRKFYNIF